MWWVQPQKHLCNVRPCHNDFYRKKILIPTISNKYMKSLSLHLSIYNMLVCHPFYDKELKCSSTTIMSQRMGRVIIKGLDIIFCQNNRKRTQRNCPSLLSKQTTLLRRNTLGKITRLVDIKSPQYSEMICQQL